MGIASGDIDRDARQGVRIFNGSEVIAGDDIVAAHAFKLIEGTKTADIGAAAAEARRIIVVVEVGTPDGLDRTQGVIADR